MKTQYKRNLLVICLILLIIFRISTLRENVKYIYNTNAQSKNHALIEYEINTSTIAITGKRILDFKFLPSVVPNLLKVICNCLLVFSSILLFYRPIFDLRKKISYLNVIYFNGGKYKALSSFN